MNKLPKRDSLPVIQSLNLKDKNSTNLLLFLNEQKYRYRIDNSGLNSEFLDSLFSLLNHVVSLAIQFSVPVSKAQLTESKITQSKSSLQMKIQEFLEFIKGHSHNNSLVSIEPSTSFCNSLRFLRKTTPSNKLQKEIHITPIKKQLNSKSNILFRSSINTPSRMNKKSFFVNSIGQNNKKKQSCKSVDNTQSRNHSDNQFHNISLIEKKDNKCGIINSNKKKGLTDIMPFHNTTKLVSKYRNVIDRYYSIKTEETDKDKNNTGNKLIYSTFHS